MMRISRDLPVLPKILAEPGPESAIRGRSQFVDSAHLRFGVWGLSFEI